MPRMRKGIHLGFSENNSGWAVGTMQGGKFSVYETRSVIFCEEILVKNVEMLYEPDPPIFEQLLEKANALSGKPPAAGTEKSVVGDVAEYQAEGLAPVEWDEPDNVSSESMRIREIDLSDFAPKTGKVATGKDQEGIPPGESHSDKEQFDDNSGGASVVFGPSSKKRRGRPKGSKDERPRKRRKKNELKENVNEEAMLSLFSQQKIEEDEIYSHLAFDEEDEEDDILEAEVFLCFETEFGKYERPSVAFHPDNPHRPKWIEAKTLEQVRLEAYKTWRKLTPEEERLWREGKIQAVPTALLLNRKRCGRFKGRLVVPE